MALFKIFKGNASAKLTDSSVTGYRQPIDGYAYYDTSTKLFYIDADYTSNQNGTISREPINAHHSLSADAATLSNAAVYSTNTEANSPLYQINNYFGHSLNLIQPTNESPNPKISLRNANGSDISGATITLGRLAIADQVSGSYQPAGTNAQSALTITPTTTTVLQNTVSTSGVLPTLTATNSGETLQISFTSGNFPVYNTINAWTGYNSAQSYAAAQTFTGTSATITLPPMEGGVSNGDSIGF